MLINSFYSTISRGCKTAKTPALSQLCSLAYNTMPLVCPDAFCQYNLGTLIENKIKEEDLGQRNKQEKA